MCELRACLVYPTGRSLKGRLKHECHSRRHFAFCRRSFYLHEAYQMMAISKFTINIQTTQWLWWLFHWFEHASSFFLLTFLLCWVKSNLPLLVSKIWIQAFSRLCPLSTLSASLLEHFAWPHLALLLGYTCLSLGGKKSTSLKGLHPKILASPVCPKSTLNITGTQ